MYSGKHNFLDGDGNLEETEKELRNSLMQAPVGIIILRGSNFIIEMANHTYRTLIDKTEKTFLAANSLMYCRR